MQLAIVDRTTGELIGAIGLHINAANRSAELGYWIGVPYWNRGYATEASRAVVQYGFEVLDLHRIFGRHMTKNPASGRVLQKLGMRHEGRLRQSLLRWGSFEDVEIHARLRDEVAAPER